MTAEGEDEYYLRNIPNQRQRNKLPPAFRRMKLVLVEMQTSENGTGCLVSIL